MILLLVFKFSSEESLSDNPFFERFRLEKPLSTKSPKLDPITHEDIFGKGTLERTLKVRWKVRV